MCFAIPKTTYYCFLDEIAVLLDQNRCTYYKLNATGAWIWSRIADGKTRSEIRAEMSLRYALSDAAVHADLNEIIDDLLGRGLLEHVTDRSAQAKE